MSTRLNRENILRSAICNLSVGNKLNKEEQEVYNIYIANRNFHKDLKPDIELFKLRDRHQAIPTWEEILRERQSRNKNISAIEVNASSNTYVNWPFIRIASCLIIMIGSYLFSQYPINVPGNLNAISITSLSIPPAIKKATLILPDNSSIQLDSLTRVLVNREGEVINASINNGKLTVGSFINSDNKNHYAILSVPNAAHYIVQLPDGTLITINAGSCIRFPATFSDDNREIVFTSGEAYFNVSKRRNKPFKINLNKAVITVYGTAFNLSTCENKADMVTTLIEGSLTVSNSESSVSLSPGQQCTLKDNHLIKRQLTDTANVTAWKNGNFFFNDESLGIIARSLSFWYDVKFTFSGNIDQKLLTLSYTRNKPLKDVLDVLSNAQSKFRYTMNKDRSVDIYP